jgi:dihydropteroate synthase
MPAVWRTSRFHLNLERPLVMGIVNATPDSFSDNGRHATATAALRHCEQLLKDGADILDIGGESTRPGSTAVALEEELDRVLPVLRAAVQLGVPVSIDTYKPQVMQAALDAGADIVNDIWALRQVGARQVVASHPACGVCLMHMQGQPASMQLQPLQGDAVPQVVLDPGIGFGKTVQQNFALLARQSELLELGYPLLAGWSRKSSLGAVTGLEAPARMVPSVAAAVLAAEHGASIVRVHDVRETVHALAVWQAMHCQK